MKINQFVFGTPASNRFARVNSVRVSSVAFVSMKINQFVFGTPASNRFVRVNSVDVVSMFVRVRTDDVVLCL